MNSIVEASPLKIWSMLLPAMFPRPRRVATAVCLTLLCLVPVTNVFAAAHEQAFASPELAVIALAKAVAANDQRRLRFILGTDGNELLSSGDAVADAHNRERFSAAYREEHQLVRRDPTHAELLIGHDAWPLPIPLVRSHGTWQFDTARGRAEILARRIGRNELDAMQVCRAIADAQREYAASHLDADGVAVYAGRFISHPGQQDGLYWPSDDGPNHSPLGPLLAAAADEGYADPPLFQQTPYRGYYFRLLGGQGEHAPDGARSYLVHGRLIGGFAVIAYPASYGTSGVSTFTINQDGRIFERNLGPDTPTLAKEIQQFDPAEGWREAGATPSAAGGMRR